MGALTPFTDEDREPVESFLTHPDALHVYLLSRLGRPAAGDGFVWREGGDVAGFAWFGTGRNLVLAGESGEFIERTAQLAGERERSWVMLLGTAGPATEFLECFRTVTGRSPRLDRTQTFCVQRPGTLPELREPGLAVAGNEDLPELAAAAARMSAEDFEIDPWRIDRAAVRRTMAEKIAEGVSYVYREEGRLAFKADLAVRHATGGQIEGVFTVEDRRGRGIASRCMAELGHRVLPGLPLLTLHVSTRNAAALRAYERAGYVRRDTLRLAIFPPVW